MLINITVLSSKAHRYMPCFCAFVDYLDIGTLNRRLLGLF